MDFPNFSVAKRIVIDLETFDPHLKKLGPGWTRKDGRIIGIAIGADGLPASYYPIGHAVGTNLDRDCVLQFMRDALHLGITIGGHNLP